MSNKTKATLQLIVVIAICAIIAALFTLYGVDYIIEVGESNPAIIFIVALLAVVYFGIGAGIKALAKVVRVKANSVFCYLPITQDIVVYNVVRGIKTSNSLHDKLKKFNWLLTGTVLIIISILLLVASPLIFNKILSTATSSNGDEVATLMVTVNSIINCITLGSLLIAYIIRVIYFDFIFKLVYKSNMARILAILPPVHLLMIAIMPNQLSYLSKTRTN